MSIFKKSALMPRYILQDLNKKAQKMRMFLAV